MDRILTEDTPHHYSLYGLRVASCVALPAHPADVREPDVRIRSGRVPESLPRPYAEGVLYQASEGQFLFRHEQVARYLVRDGREIVIEPAAKADPERLRLFLMSSPFGALLHQRNLLPLHGSAVDVNGQGVVFAGMSGAGKSTLAAAFLKRGYPVLADDISVVSVNDDGQPMVHPGHPQIRLWADAVQRVDQDADTLSRMLPDLEKYLLAVPGRESPAPLPLRHICVLHVNTDGRLDLSVVTGARKLEALHAQTYRRGFLERMGSKTAHFTLCAAVARRVPMSRVTRPSQPFLLDELVALLDLVPARRRAPVHGHSGERV